VSNFHLLSNTELVRYGWYPYVQTAPPIINPVVQKLTERRMFNGVVVLQSWAADTMTPAEALAYATATLTEITASITPFLNQAVAPAYETIVTAKSWLNSSEPDWAREAAQANSYADLVWKAQKATVAAVQAGTRQVPTKAAFFAQFPPLWPPSNGNGPIV
jgi:hypothetical protein